MSTVPGYEVHPAADLFPLMVGAEFDALVDDIREHGQIEAVIIDAYGKLIDGRNRVRACQQLGVEPVTKKFYGSDVTQFVVSHNLHRRHLTDSQRAMIAAKLAQRGPGQRSDQIGHMTDLPLTRPEAAQLLGVSETAIGRAHQVERAGTPELQELVVEGLAPVTTGARIALTLTAAEQKAYVESVRAGADPVRSAPDFLAPATPKPKPCGRPAPRPGANKRKHLQQIDALIVALQGVTAAFDGVPKLDTSVTAEEASRAMADLSTQIQALRRIQSLLKERTS